MPLIIINKNGIDLEEIERMQDEKDTYVISVSESVPKEIKRRVESGE
ncbi:hypothetical protein [Treponema succinifaciens]|uniref:Uncharacterized protein n=1 Tax=Treponema succinifaciens (strain ATCC 33096 / DSM 2489 / 6091) TaxID=869209 RepID=F2NT17_TRES6|nr:hypothetical protein [Treponema succinifaciens]AEB14608.1 hypothetical protein Tresu_1716 [Treponema succinifaciens DSM 2489]